MVMIKKKLIVLALIFLCISIILLLISLFYKIFSLLILSFFFGFIFLTILLKKIQNVLLITTSTIFAFFIVEILISLVIFDDISVKYDKASDCVGWKFWDRKSDLGHQPKPGKHSCKMYDPNGEVIFDVVYTIDEDGFRFTNKNKAFGETINFFGGSFMFGHGLSDQQTLPYYVSESLNINAKNYGVGGYGAHQALAILQSDRNTDASINIFWTAPFHALRSACKKTYSSSNPKYTLVDGGKKLIRDGKCPNEKLLGRVLKHSAIYNFITRNFHLNVTDQDIELYLRIVSEIYNISKSRKQTFIIGFYKSQENYFKDTKFSNQSIFLELQKYSDEIVDLTLSDKRDNIDKKYILHILDGHPSSIANFEGSKIISKAIKKYIYD